MIKTKEPSSPLPAKLRLSVLSWQEFQLLKPVEHHFQVDVEDVARLAQHNLTFFPQPRRGAAFGSRASSALARDALAEDVLAAAAKPFRDSLGTPVHHVFSRARRLRHLDTRCEA